MGYVVNNVNNNVWVVATLPEVGGGFGADGVQLITTFVASSLFFAFFALPELRTSPSGATTCWSWGMLRFELASFRRLTRTPLIGHALSRRLT